MKTKITFSEYKIIKAIPRALTLKEIADKTGYSLPYISRKIKQLYFNKAVLFYFKPDFVKMGLKPTIVILPYKRRIIERFEKNEYIYTLSLSHIANGIDDYLLVYAVPPAQYVEEYINSLPTKPIEYYTDLHDYYWRPDKTKLTILKKKDLSTDWDRLYNEYEYQKRNIEGITNQREKIKLDNIDLFILAKLRKNLFISISKIGEMLGISQQLASYHFRNHVLRIWDHNVVKILFDVKKILVKMHKFVFRNYVDAYAFANTISQSPYSIATFLSEKDPLVIWSARLPCEEEIYFNRILRQQMSIFIDEYRFLGFMESDLMLRWTIPLDAISKGKWIFRRVKVPLIAGRYS